MKRSPLKRRTRLRSTRNLERTTPLKRTRITAKPAERIPEAVRARVAARSQGRCEVFDGATRCENPADHMHHRLPRSRGGRHTASNLLHVCWADHARIHEHPEWAYSVGYLLRTPPVTLEKQS